MISRELEVVFNLALKEAESRRHVATSPQSNECAALLCFRGIFAVLG